MAQLVEHNLAKVGVAGSNPVVRSNGVYRVFPRNPDVGHDLARTHNLRSSCPDRSVDENLLRKGG